MLTRKFDREPVISILSLDNFFSTRLGPGRTQPIALWDLVRYLAGVAGRPEALGRTLGVAGLEVTTCLDMILRVGDLRRRRPRALPVCDGA